MRATFDFPEKSFENIIRSDGLPVRLREAVKGQTRLQITLQALYCRRIDGLILLDKRRHRLISLLSAFLVEQGLQLRFDLLLLFVRYVAEHVIHLVNHTALASRGGKFLGDGVEHGLIAITHPQANLFDPTCFEIVEEVFPRLLVLAIADAKGQHLALTSSADAHDGENGHLAALT